MSKISLTTTEYRQICSSTVVHHHVFSIDFRFHGINSILLKSMNNRIFDVGCGFVKIKPRLSSENLSVIHFQHCIFFKVNPIPVERNSVISYIISIAAENDFFIYQPIDIEFCVFRNFQTAVFGEINFRSFLYIKGFSFG